MDCFWYVKSEYSDLRRDVVTDTYVGNEEGIYEDAVDMEVAMQG